MGKRGGELTLTGFFVLIKNQRTVVALECDSGGQLVLSINRSTKDESRRMTRRQGVDIAGTGRNANQKRAIGRVRGETVQ
ncbi:hypothetical protein L207DRAFT_505770 [Hyaloscypha variabilis F]|uniref:Uncharacterized protein n=1 Tax=Hyaloscypha variabilis (strain UAMH 11265 / GT02V1 / F) TaxID=1149755 RepID=A0A2J6SD79_HYAVF|nr:hypothetical protein L207DRAFT_505770 [Hyaloscypha variabilis F]